MNRTRAGQEAGGRKIVVVPDGSVLPWVLRQATTAANPALLTALAWAFRCRLMPEDGRSTSVSDIRRLEKINRTDAGALPLLVKLAISL
jgi:hypothetical protein